MRVFVTGASGFLGRRVCERLLAAGHQVVGLQRHAGGTPHQLQGDLLDPARYEAALRDSNVVVHLAALTGKAPNADYVRVNVEGTRALVDAARRAGITNLLFCSSIAVTFPDLRGYPYGQSKLDAEKVVASSGLRYTTIRPTIIAGADSPVMSKLADLASLPLIPAFGGGAARVQPIDVSDLAALIVAIVEHDRFNGETLELGGPDVLTLRDLLDRMHRQSRQAPGRFLSVPLGLLLPIVGMAERVLGPALPMTVGQLATFRFDGVARPNDLATTARVPLTTVNAMLSAARAVR